MQCFLFGKISFWNNVITRILCSYMVRELTYSNSDILTHCWSLLQLFIYSGKPYIFKIFYFFVLWFGTFWAAASDILFWSGFQFFIETTFLAKMTSMKDDLNSWKWSYLPKYVFQLFKLTKPQKTSQVEPELGTAQPQLVFHITQCNF